MLCNTCNIKGICKVFDMINTPGISVEMKSCSYRTIPGAMPIVQIDKDNMPTINKEAIKEAEDKVKSFLSERKSRAYQDISELSNKLKAEKEAQKKKNNAPQMNILEIEEGDEVECSQCNEKTTTSFNCPICQKQICLGCAMTHISTNGQVMHICEECWANDADTTSQTDNTDNNEEEIDEQ